MNNELTSALILSFVDVHLHRTPSIFWIIWS